ncbi:MAG: hypothetical protein OXC40_00590 [Proteobacteria bacterium]|nr:hypothetical protein [Pseudomonadota bacterium]
MAQGIPSDLFDTLATTLTGERKKRMEQVASSRLPWLRCVLQDIHSEHNISACLRSCEAFGVGSVDVLSLLTTKKSFRPTSVACGISHWLNIQEFNAINSYSQYLKQNHYKLFAGIPSSHSRANKQILDVEQIPRDAADHGFKIAVLFGNERLGIDPEWHNHIDGYFTVPTVGFVESLNVSVAVAVTLYAIIQSGNHLLAPKYLVSDQDIKAQLGIWITKTVPKWQEIYDHEKNKK